MTREINLYNPALAPRVELFSGQVMLFGLAGVLGVCLVAWMASDYRAARAAQREAAQAAQLAQVQGEVARLTSQAAQRSSDPAVRDALARVEALLTQRSQVLATLDSGVLGDTGGVSEYFRAFARQTVNGVWLTGFSVARAGSEIVIQGRTLDAALVPGFLARLRDEAALRGHGFESLTVSRPNAAPGSEDKHAGYLEFRMATSLRDAAKSGAAQ